MTKSRANAILQSRASSRTSRREEARLLANPEYIEIRRRLRETTNVDERKALIDRKYEILEELAA